MTVENLNLQYMLLTELHCMYDLKVGKMEEKQNNRFVIKVYNVIGTLK